MSENELRFYPTLPSVQGFTSDKNTDSAGAKTDPSRLEPATCTEAEPFALRVLDDSMQPEFRKGCIIVIDPTGRATEGSYVLAKDLTSATAAHGSSDAIATGGNESESFVFRQLNKNPQGEWILKALNDNYPELPTSQNLGRVVGVIVQRAGVRRNYHKRYT